MNYRQEVKFLKSQLKENSDSKRAEGEKKYLKSPLKHYGVTIPGIRKIAKTWIKNHQDSSLDQVAILAKQLWNSKWHEDKTLAIEILAFRLDQLTSRQVPLLEHMIYQVTGWSHLDPLAITIFGSILQKDKSNTAYLKKWIKSNNFWVRRAAILAQILQFRRGQGDFELFKQVSVPNFNEGKNWSKEEKFFIRKAIGWALRELSPHKPKLVHDFVKKYQNQMSGLTFREATRKLPAKYRNQLK